MIRIERVALPAGLRAIARRDLNGDLVIYVSDLLDAKRQRAAVLEALRASRRTGWRAWLPPIGLVLLAPLRRWARHAAAAVRTHPVGWAAATTVVVAGAAASGIFLGTAPHRHDSASTRPPAASISLPLQPRQQHAPGSRARQLPPAGAISPGSPGAPARPSRPGAASPAPGQPPPAPAQAPSASGTPGSPPAPSPAPTPSPTRSGGQESCVIILKVRVCLPLVSLSVAA